MCRSKTVMLTLTIIMTSIHADFGEIPELMEYVEQNYDYWNDKDKDSRAAN